MRAEPADFLPLKDLPFRILVALSDGDCHGGRLAQVLDDGTGRVLPGHLYRTLDRMIDDGLIEERDAALEAPPPTGRRGASPSRFFHLTPLGVAVARAETRRLEALIARSRAGRLLRPRR